MLVLSFPVLLHAGIVSYVSGLLTESPVHKQQGNSQTVALLEAPLNINPAPLTGGANITIVENSALLAESDPNGGLSENVANRSISDQISIYVVREGDSIGSIAKAFGVSANTIRWNNDLTGSTITPGQTLTILPISGIRHTVKKGDTVASIAKLYKGDVSEVEKYNDVTTTSSLSIGDIVIIPNGEPTTGNSSSVVKLAASSKSYSGYFIRPTTGPKTQGIHGHNGIDIAPIYGTAIVAAADGKVIVSKTSGWNGGYGSYVVIGHPNGTQTLYAHMSNDIIETDSSVKQGQIIGYVGNSGESTGPHLHFEVRGARNPF